MSKESYSRLKINKLLEESGWILIDTLEQKKNVDTEPNVKYGNGGDGGFIDYLLFDKKGFPLVVIEAKKEERDPLVGKEQARTYAMNIKARFIILSNGNIHYLWDIQSGNPRVINVFPTQETLIGYEEYKPKKELIINEIVESDFIVQTQFPTYKNDPDYINEKTRGTFITNNKLCFLRDYQIKAINSVQNSIKEGNDRFLWEMATGTGKTATSAGIIKLFLRTENSKRVLFLVDRIELEEQAQKAFNNYLKNDYTCVIWKENKEDWKKAEIVVSTIQSFMHKNKYKRVFQPNDFDFVISDEAHRSIGGNSRSVFEYFIGYKLGLTATPKDYLKRVEKENISQNDPREYERRMILDTYHTFGCDSGNPTFRYSLLDGVKGGFLINPVVIDARTEITTQLLSDEGFTFKTQDDEGKDVESVYEVLPIPKKIKSSEFLLNGKYPIIDQSDSFISGFWNNEEDIIRIDSPVIIFGDHSRVFKFIDFNFVAGADGIKILKPNKNIIDPKYLYFILKNIGVKNLGYSRHYKELKNKQIPLPPLEVQEEIVRELEKYQKIIDGARQVIDNYKPTIDINPIWEMKELESLINFVSGVTLSIPDCEDENGIKIISMADITEDGEIVTHKIRKVKIKKGNYSLLQKGDLLFNWRNGSTHLVGKTGIFELEGDYVFASFCIGIRVKEKLLTKYLWYLLNQYRRDGVYFTFMRKSINGLFNREELKILVVPIPSIEEQKIIIEKLDYEMNLVSKSKDIIEIFNNKIQNKINKIWSK